MTTEHVANPVPPADLIFYKRVLPETCIAFSSDAGKKLFRQSLESGYADIFFLLSEQFITQAEPAYCGLTNLVMALNVLQVDPKRVWKMPWRWYHEEMLDCCYSLDVIQQQGITMDQFANLAICNNLDLSMVRVTDHEKEDDFRDVVKQICSGEGRILVCSYSRETLGQTGDGHFTTIGAYHAEQDMVLIMDTARFKYPPHWVKLSLFWEAMKRKDTVTNLPRGYFQIQRSAEVPLLLFRLSKTFRVTISSRNGSLNQMNNFFQILDAALKDFDKCTGSNDRATKWLTHILKPLNAALETLTDGESFFTTQFDTCCFEALPEEYSESVLELLRAIEETKVYKAIQDAVRDFRKNNVLTKENEGKLHCYVPNCLARIGKSVENAEETAITTRHSVTPCCTEGSDNTERSVPTCVQNSADGGQHLVTECHYVAMLFLSWPYPDRQHNPKTCQCVRTFVYESITSANQVLQNEVSCLQQQISSLRSLIK